MTPSFIGRIATMLPGVLPSISFASLPTASTFLGPPCEEAWPSTTLGSSIVVYLVFCMLIGIFGINFRPGQSRGDDNGCRGTSNVVLSVDGTDSTQTAYKIAYSNPYNRGAGKNKVFVALETLIRRE